MDLKTKLGIGISGVVGLALFVKGIDAVDRWDHNNLVQRQNVEQLIEKTLEIAAGEDSILDTREKARLLEELGLHRIVQDQDALHLQYSGPTEVKVETYSGIQENVVHGITPSVTTGPRHVTLDWIPTSSLQKYIAYHQKKS